MMAFDMKKETVVSALLEVVRFIFLFIYLIFQALIVANWFQIIHNNKTDYTHQRNLIIHTNETDYTHQRNWFIHLLRQKNPNNMYVVWLSRLANHPGKSGIIIDLSSNPRLSIEKYINFIIKHEFLNSRTV